MLLSLHSTAWLASTRKRRLENMLCPNITMGIHLLTLIVCHLSLIAIAIVLMRRAEDLLWENWCVHSIPGVHSTAAPVQLVCKGCGQERERGNWKGQRLRAEDDGGVNFPATL